MRFSSLSMGALGCVLAGSIAAPVARAELTICSIVGRIGTTTDYACGSPRECSDASMCEPLPLDTPTCERFFGDVGVCVPACSSMFGCDASGECPMFLGTTGACTPFEAGASGGEPSGICLYAAPTVAVTYCAEPAGAVIPHYFTSCHTDPSGDLAPSYWQGDCDVDGCPNGIDPMPCVEGGECGTVHRGGLCGPSIATDAGMAETEDGGPTIVVDGSNPGDGGRQRDGGSIGDGGGVTTGDGGTIGRFDGGSAGDGPRFAGGGGCRCAAPGATGDRRDHGRMIALLASIVLALGLRRRVS
jgi:hypothetical protein